MEFMSEADRYEAGLLSHDMQRFIVKTTGLIELEVCYDEVVKETMSPSSDFD